MTHDLICPSCESGTLRAATFEAAHPYEGVELHVSGLQHFQCSHCDATPVFYEQAKHNQRLIADAKRAHSGLLSGESIRAIREHLGYTQAKMADLIGCGVMAFSKYERGEVVQSAAMDKLLRILRAIPRAVSVLESSEAWASTISLPVHRKHIALNDPAEATPSVWASYEITA